MQNHHSRDDLKARGGAKKSPQIGIQKAVCGVNKTTMFALDAATELTPVEDNCFRREVDQTWWNFDSAFGGWAAATAYEAVAQSAERRGELLSLNAVFPRAIKAGTVEVRTDLMARRGQSDFWRVTLYDKDRPDELLVAMDLIMGKKRPLDDARFEKIPPDAPDPDAIPALDSEGLGPAWLQHYEQRPFVGTPFGQNVQPKSVAWIAHKDERVIDTKALIALSDTPMPRVFFTTKDLRFGSTISFSVSSACGEEELARLAPRRAIIQTESRSVGRGSYDQIVSIWSDCGTLLCMSNQTALFK